LVSLFKLFDLPRVLLLLLLLVLYAVFSGALSFPITSYELMSLVTSEHLTTGNMMYRDVFHWTEPLTAWVQYIFFFLFGRNILYYRIVALTIIFFQAVLFNQVLNEKGCFDQRTSLPSLIYLSFCVLFPDMLSLSAVVLANTFLLILFYFIISYIKENESTQPLFWIGFTSSLAFLFYAPYLVLLPASLCVLVLYSPIDARKIVTILYAFILPFIVVWAFFFWNDAAGFFMQVFLQKVLSFQANHHLSFQYLLWIIALPLAWLFIGFVAIARSSAFVNYQSRVIQSVFLFFLFSMLGMLLVKERSVFTMWQLVPFVAIIATHFLILQKRKWLASFVLLASFGALVYIHIVLQKSVDDPSSSESTLVARYDRRALAPFKEKKTLLVLGNEVGAYTQYKLATPFLNWSLSEPYFRDMDSYESVCLLDRYFSKEMPDVIIDPHAVMADVFFRLPLVSNKYEEKSKGVFLLRR
jgi:hypothetical protein